MPMVRKLMHFRISYPHLYRLSQHGKIWAQFHINHLKCFESILPESGPNPIGMEFWWWLIKEGIYNIRFIFHKWPPPKSLTNITRVPPAEPPEDDPQSHACVKEDMESLTVLYYPALKKQPK